MSSSVFGSCVLQKIPLSFISFSTKDSHSPRPMCFAAIKPSARPSPSSPSPIVRTTSFTPVPTSMASAPTPNIRAKVTPENCSNKPLPYGKKAETNSFSHVPLPMTYFPSTLTKASIVPSTNRKISCKQANRGSTGNLIPTPGRR